MRLRRAGWALLAVALGLACVEGAAAIAEPWARPSLTMPEPRPGDHPDFRQTAMRARDKLQGIPMVRDDATVWGLPADRIVLSGDVPCRINTLGLRGPELGPRAEGEVRLLTLGDSSVFGDGVPEAQVFSSVAAQSLTARWGRPVSGVIGGVPGHDSDQALARLRQKGTAVDPDWVVIATLWSDIYKFEGFLRPQEVERVRRPLERVATYRVLRTLLEPFLLPRRVRWIASMEHDAIAGNSRVALRRYIENLRAMAREAAVLGARVAFLALPAPVDLDPAGAPENVAAYRAAMREVAAEGGAPFVDSAGWFVGHGATIGYFADQVHPNAFGHRMIGEALTDALAAAGP